MEPSEIYRSIQNHTEAEISLLEEGPEPSVRIPREAVLPILKFLKSAQDLAFTTLMNQTAVHDQEVIRLYWHLFSYPQKHRLTVESAVPLDKPEVDSVTTLWKAANWLERETYDLFGVVFRGHPDLRRIMLPEDWEGHPLRKDYINPDGYQDIDNSPSEIDRRFLQKGK